MVPHAKPHNKSMLVDKMFTCRISFLIGVSQRFCQHFHSLVFHNSLEIEDWARFLSSARLFSNLWDFSRLVLVVMQASAWKTPGVEEDNESDIIFFISLMSKFTRTSAESVRHTKNNTRKWTDWTQVWTSRQQHRIVLQRYGNVALWKKKASGRRMQHG